MRISRTHPYTTTVCIVANRKGIVVPDGRTLWAFANLYFQPRNAMMYRVVHEKDVDEIAIIAVRRETMDREDTFFTTGNAAHSQSDILERADAKSVLGPIVKDAVTREWWKEEDGTKRKMMAECLVPDLIPPEFVDSIYVASHEAATKARDLVKNSDIAVIPQPRWFFEPTRKVNLTRHLALVEGDMFFSRMHTLTVSVNCVGVMGKGLASRAKYQFPDVYVLYQDLCRKRTLRMGKPYLYKRESPLDYSLSDEPATLSNGDPESWFLLFPTKQHWRQRSDIDGIEAGLRWLQDAHLKEGIKSLAIPALGCGLGRLEWRDVGPILCKYLAAMDIPIRLYMPAEREILDEHLTREFLLPQADGWQSSLGL